MSAPVNGVRYISDGLQSSAPSARVGSESYALARYRYIELNPVRAGMTAHPTDYSWTSYRCNAPGTFEAHIKAHPSCLQLEACDADRQNA